MIKRVIFDIDNTLIPWKQEYYNEIKNVLDELNVEYTEQDYIEIKKAFGEYENVYYTFDRKVMMEYINNYTKKNYPKEFIYKITKKWENCVPEKIDENILKLLEYLKTKYEIVILTDWYEDQQSERLQKIDILKYFQKVYSAENTKRKPFKEAFMQALGDNRPEECIMIGDNFERDIQGALNAGLQAIWYNPNNKTETTKDIEYYEISNLKEVNTIL